MKWIMSLIAVVIFHILLVGYSTEYEYVYYYEDEDGYYYEYEDEMISAIENAAPLHSQIEHDQYESSSTHYRDSTFESEEEYVNQGLYDNAEQEVVVVPEPQQKYGFLKTSGSGLKKIAAPLVTTKALDEVASQFGCFLKKNAGPQKVMDPAYLKAKETVAAANKSKETLKDSKDKATTQKKLSPREMDLARIKAKEDDEKRLKVKYPQGVECEALVCGACKAIVEEFGSAVHQAISDPRYMYIYDIADTFCDRLANKLTAMVLHFCKILMDEGKGYREAVVGPFEEDTSIDDIASASSLFAKKKRICMAVGACAPVQFAFSTEPEARTQEQWQDDCYVCQVAVKEIEERITLTRLLSDTTASSIVAGTCDRIGLETKYDKHCRELISGPRIEEFAWLAKVQYEVISKKELGVARFPDRVCEGVVNQASGKKFCEKWLDPAELKRKAIEESIEAVFY